MTMAVEMQQTMGVSRAVGIGELVVSDDPRVTLVAHGLGSCVAVVAYCAGTGIGGMVHIMLPEAQQGDRSASVGKYADTGVDALVSELRERGVTLAKTSFKLAGGAAVLRVAGNNRSMRVGERNIEAVEATLKHLGVRVRARDLGGNRGRTVELDVETGRVSIRTFGDPGREL